MEMNERIFKKYDLRGAYPEELNDEMAYQIGKGFAVYTRAKKIVVGGDARISSPTLKDAIIRGITDQGADVIDIGLCSTSCFYYTLADSQLEAGIMVTASHAPKIFNGFKFALKDATPLTKEQLLDLKKIVLENQFPVIENSGQVIKIDPAKNYIEAVRKTIKGKIDPLRIVMDPGNGTAGLYLEKIFAETGVEIVPIFFEPDGNFPNHETNPKIPENRIKLIEKIKEEKADLGCMFDGDADRVYIFDRNGDVIDPSLVIALISEYFLNNSDKKKIVIEVRTSNVVKNWVKKAGGEVLVSTCWTIPIKLEMKTNPDVVFGGETSGHYMFPELHASDDGIMGVLTFLQAIGSKKESLDEIVEDFKNNYFVLDEKNFELTDKSAVEPILTYLKNKYAKEGGEIAEIDGLSVIFPDWWFNLRASETEPCIRLNFEANSKELFEERKNILIKEIEDKINA